MADITFDDSPVNPTVDNPIVPNQSGLDAGIGTYPVPANFGQNTTPIAPNGQSSTTPSGLTDEYGNPISWNPNLSTATTYTNGKNAGTAVTDSSTGTTTTPTDGSSPTLSSVLNDISKFVSTNKSILGLGALASAATSNGGGGSGAGSSSAGIPALVASRMQVPGASSIVTPGQANQQYFTDTLYTDPSQQANAMSAIEAQAQAIAANRTNAPVPNFAMPYNTPKASSGLTPASNLAPLYTNYTPTDIGNYIAQNNINVNDPAAVAAATKATNANPAVVNQYIASLNKTGGQAGIAALPGSINTTTTPTATNTPATTVPTPKSNADVINLLQQTQASNPTNTNAAIAKMMYDNNISAAQMAAATGLTTAEIQNLYNQATSNHFSTLATPTAQVSTQLQNAAAALNNPATKNTGIATLNNLIQANGLNASQLQSMFPSVDLSQYFSQGVTAPGSSSYTAPTPTPSPVLASILQADQANNINNSALTSANSPNGVASLPTPSPTPTPTTTPTPTASAAPPANTDAITQIVSQGQAAGQSPAEMAATLISQGIPAADVIAVVGAGNADVVNQAYAAASAPVDNASYNASFGYDTAADGGLMELHYATGGATPTQPRYLQGHTDGMADELNTSIDGIQPAKLSHGEFVIPADVVSHLGNGNSDAGAKKLYEMMSRVRKARTGNEKQGKKIDPDKFMYGGRAYAKGGVATFADGQTVPAAVGSTTGIPGVTNTGGTASQGLSSYVAPYVTNMLGQGQALANTSMPVYQGPLTAGQSALQNQQFMGLSEMAQTGYDPTQFQTQNWSNQGASQMPNLSVPSQTQSVSQAANQGTAGYGQPMDLNMGQGSSPASQYMNPYLQQSLQPQLNLLAQTSKINEQGDLGKLTSQGAYGGSRQAVLQGMDQNALLGQQANLIGQGYNTAYNDAQSQFNADQQRQMQAQQNTEASRQFSANFGQQNLAALGQAGGVQQGIQNVADQAAYAEFQKQQQYPYQQLAFEQSLLQGLPTGTTTTTPNAMSDLGTALSALGVGTSLSTNPLIQSIFGTSTTAPAK